MTSIMLRNFSQPVSPSPNISEFRIDTAPIVDMALRKRARAERCRGGERERERRGAGVLVDLAAKYSILNPPQRSLEGACTSLSFRATTRTDMFPTHAYKRKDNPRPTFWRPCFRQGETDTDLKVWRLSSSNALPRRGSATTSTPHNSPEPSLTGPQMSPDVLESIESNRNGTERAGSALSIG